MISKILKKRIFQNSPFPILKRSITESQFILSIRNHKISELSNEEVTEGIKTLKTPKSILSYQIQLI